jgi:hypothetical protein
MGIKDGLCSGFDGKLSSAMGTMDQIKGLMGSPTSRMNTELGNLVGGISSPAGDMTSGLDSIASGVGDSLPDIPDISDVESVLQDCDLLKGSLLGGLQSPADLVSGFISTVLGAVGDAIGGILGAIGNLIEAPLAFIIKEIDDLLSSFGVPNLLSGLDGLFDCYDSLCDTDVQDDIDYIDDALYEMNLDDEGYFDSEMAFAGYDIPEDIKTNVLTLVDKLKEEDSKAEEQVQLVADSMSESIDKIIDANVDAEPGDTLVTVAEAVQVEAIKQSNNLKSFFA